jgi:hypothetical protein
VRRGAYRALALTNGGSSAVLDGSAVIEVDLVQLAQFELMEGQGCTVAVTADLREGYHMILSTAAKDIFIFEPLGD